MKRTISIILCIAICISMGIVAFAEDFVIPRQDITNDIKGNYDLLSTLRVTFPDQYFEKNQKIIDDIVAGNRNSILGSDEKEYSYLTGSGLYLLPYQMDCYNNEFTKINVTNPYLINILNKKEFSQGDLYLTQTIIVWFKDKNYFSKL